MLLRSLVYLTAFVFPSLAEQKLSAGDFIVKDLPGLKNIPKKEVPQMYAGELELYDTNNTDYFFWKIVSPQQPNRTTFWLNGGPGCSSMDGMLLENGPFRVGKDQNLILNNGSWHKQSNMVYVDQPGGVGLSTLSDDDTPFDEISIQSTFLKFLEQYFRLFPAEAGNDIYLAGESYAGQYIPYIATAVLNAKYNFKGLMIGNGYVSPAQQDSQLLSYFVERKLINESNENWDDLKEIQDSCDEFIVELDKNASIPITDLYDNNCTSMLEFLLEATRDTKAAKNKQCYNTYDYKLKDSYPACGSSWPQEYLPETTKYLNNQKVQIRLNINKRKRWQECVNLNEFVQDLRPAVELLPSLLEKVPIVLYNGDLDIICNTKGVLSYIDKLTWKGDTGFTNTSKSAWYYGDKDAGYVLSSRNLTFVNVWNASHMVPYNVPEISRSLFDFFGDYEIKTKDGKKIYQTYPL